jgi:hypothetical protein
MTGLPSPSSAASGCATTETSRGLLYPRYRVNTDGLIEEKQSYPTHITKPEIIGNDLRRFIPPRSTWLRSSLPGNASKPFATTIRHLLRNALF